MAYSDVEIVNLALDALGRDTIRTFSTTEEDPKSGRISKRVYTSTRDTMISLHDWSFARKTVTLQQETAEHPEGTLYKLPSDCYVPRRILPRGTRPNIWRVEGRSVMIPIELVSAYGVAPMLRYTRLIEDTRWFPPYFILALHTEIASRLCMPLTRDKKYAKELKAEARAWFRQAQYIDSNLDNDELQHFVDLDNDSFINPDGRSTIFNG